MCLFLNKFKTLGRIEYDGDIPLKINSSLLSVSCTTDAGSSHSARGVCVPDCTSSLRSSDLRSHP